MRNSMENSIENSIDYDAVVFDMDGVIFDSERAVMQCWKELQKNIIFRILNRRCFPVREQR